MLSFGRSFSTRLYIQAALTGLLAPMNAHGSVWLVLTFAVAVGALVVASTLRNDESRTRELVIGFEAVALAVGALGLVGHHYIPGTIVGVMTLVMVLKTHSGNAPRIVMPAPVAVAYPSGPDEAVASEPASVPAAAVLQPVTAAAQILPGRHRR